MNFTVYARRAARSIIYIAMIFLLIFGLMYVFSDKQPGANFMDTMVPEKNRLPLIGFIVFFGLVYPFITFIKKNVYINKSFSEERDGIIKIFETSGYSLIKEEGTKLFFRPVNKISRIMRMMEDMVELDYSDNPLVLSGMRKEIYRIGKHIEYMSMKHNIEE